MGQDFRDRSLAALPPQYDHEVLLTEDCEGTYKWTHGGTGTDYSGVFDTGFCYFGSKGWKLRTRTTTPAVDDYMTATRVFGFPFVKRIILRGRVSCSTKVVLKGWAAQLGIWTGVRNYQATILWQPNVPSFSYYGPAGAYVAMPALAFVAMDYDWFDFEVGLDLVNNQFTHVRFGGVEVSLAGIAMYDAAATTNRDVTVQFQITAAGANLAEAGMDSVFCGAYSHP